jgi:hypothetical protein
MSQKLGKEKVNLIICHVGSGASITAVKDSKSYDTTMGLTPLDGLMMGTRSGSIDPSIIKYMIDESGMTYAEIDEALNKKSGLLGICGFNDNRDVEQAIQNGNEDARLALDMYVDRIDRYIAEYYIELGGKVDAIVFTAGVLENGAETRESIIEGLEPLGIKINHEVNNAIAYVILTDTSPFTRTCLVESHIEGLLHRLVLRPLLSMLDRHIGQFRTARSRRHLGCSHSHRTSTEELSSLRSSSFFLHLLHAVYRSAFLKHLSHCCSLVYLGLSKRLSLLSLRHRHIRRWATHVLSHLTKDAEA